MANVVLSGVSEDAGVQGSLFEGIKFWLSQKVPQRSRFVNDVKVNNALAQSQAKLSQALRLTLNRPMVAQSFQLRNMQM